jgi:hypothetical protein
MKRSEMKRSEMKRSEMKRSEMKRSEMKTFHFFSNSTLQNYKKPGCREDRGLSL